MEIFLSCTNLITLLLPFLSKTPTVIKLSIPLLIPLTGRSILSPSCLLPLLLSSHLAIHLFLLPSLTLDIYPHFSTPRNWCIWRRGPLRLSLCLSCFIFLPSVILAVSHHLAFLKLIYCLCYLVLAEWTWRTQLNFLLNWCPLSAGDILMAPLCIGKQFYNREKSRSEISDGYLYLSLLSFYINDIVWYCSAGLNACTCMPEWPLLTLMFNYRWNTDNNSSYLSLICK